MLPSTQDCIRPFLSEVPCFCCPCRGCPAVRGRPLLQVVLAGHVVTFTLDLGGVARIQTDCQADAVKEVVAELATLLPVPLDNLNAECGGDIAAAAASGTGGVRRRRALLQGATAVAAANGSSYSSGGGGVAGSCSALLTLAITMGPGADLAQLRDRARVRPRWFGLVQGPMPLA